MAQFLIRKNASGHYWFVLKANNHKIVLQSQMYETDAGARKGIAAIKRDAADAVIVDETHKHSDRETNLDNYVD
ncbi:MAG: DUF1508 domain-containing protein [Candidatus Melainabacteria bacterium]|nr:MAG: DUF1508 domain-containing protein [Candidatus Melainabacteria bacterium]